MWSVAQENGSSPALRTVPSTSTSKATSEKKRPLRPEAPRQNWRAASRALPQIRFNVKSQFNAAENRLDELSLSPQLPPALGISECPDRQAGNSSLQINQNTTAPSSSPGRQDWSQTSSPPVTPGPNSPAPPARRCAPPRDAAHASSAARAPSRWPGPWAPDRPDPVMIALPRGDTRRPGELPRRPPARRAPPAAPNSTRHSATGSLRSHRRCVRRRPDGGGWRRGKWLDGTAGEPGASGATRVPTPARLPLNLRQGRWPLPPPCSVTSPSHTPQVPTSDSPPLTPTRTTLPRRDS